MIFHEIGLHKPDFDETWYDHNYVTRRITACYSRYNDIFEIMTFFQKTPLTLKVAFDKKVASDKQVASEKK